jgi:hypothetical protein
MKAYFTPPFVIVIFPKLLPARITAELIRKNGVVVVTAEVPVNVTISDIGSIKSENAQG